MRLLPESPPRSSLLRGRVRSLSTSTPSGPAAPTILEEAARQPSDLVVLGARGLGAVAGFLLGSVSLGVARHAHCSVLVVKGATGALRGVLVGLDGSEHAQTAIRHAVWLGERLQATVVGLHVVDVVSVEGSGSFLHDISGSLGFEPYLDFSAKMREALRERGRVLLEAFARRCSERSVPSDTVLAMGIVANEICDQARVADLVVVGHRGVNEQFSTGLLGSTTESVARKSPKPVLVCPMRFAPITRPLLAYDGSARASAASRRFGSSKVYPRVHLLFFGVRR